LNGKKREIKGQERAKEVQVSGVKKGKGIKKKECQPTRGKEPAGQLEQGGEGRNVCLHP